MRYSAQLLKKVWFNQITFGLEIFLPHRRLRPGQFFQVRVNESLSPFLNRPISIASYKKDKLLLIIKIVGKGTASLSKKSAGERLLLFGPYGKGIIKFKRKRSLLLAGGIGIAPLYFLGQTLHKAGIKFDIIYGAKKEEELILKNEISQLANTTFFVTESGRKGSTVIKKLTSIDLKKYECFYACGPRAMLIALQKLSLTGPCYAFCEDLLGCGCGLCLGCAIMYQGKYKRICEDGPVFELGGIEFGM